MTLAKRQALLELINELVHEKGNWQEKRNDMIDTMGGISSELEEFISWFDR